MANQPGRTDNCSSNRLALFHIHCIHCQLELTFASDNEFSQSVPEQAGYFVDLQNAYHASDIAVPLTYNDPGPRRNFINGTGAVDLYG